MSGVTDFSRRGYNGFYLISHIVLQVEVINDCALGERKNMNLPGCIVDLPTLTPKVRCDYMLLSLRSSHLAVII
jgi:hypothetical protein